MLSHDLVKIETYLNAYQAQIAKSKLDANNIYCYLKDEEIVQQDWLRTIAYGGVKLYVRKEDEILAKNDTKAREHKNAHRNRMLPCDCPTNVPLNYNCITSPARLKYMQASIRFID